MSTEFAVHSVIEDLQPAEAGVAAELGLPAEVLMPLLHGARARGFADALELMGQAAVLIDACGTVLHLTGPARKLLGGGISVAGGHLVGESAEANRELSLVIGEALSARAAGTRETVVQGGGGNIKVRAMGLGTEFHSPFQRLRAAILLHPVRGTSQKMNS